MPGRIQSPSSINTYRQCPRKYFYQYIKELPTKPSIHLVRGRIVHSVLEDFFRIDADSLSSDYDFDLKIIMHELINRHWNESHDELQGIGIPESLVDFYLSESKDMLQMWLIEFVGQLRPKLAMMTLPEAFRSQTPETEVHFVSETLGVQGYIDAIHRQDGHVKILDYKTSSRDTLTDGYRLQLAIYALLFKESFGRAPDEVGIHFLKFCERCIPVDEKLLCDAHDICCQIHEQTKSSSIGDYPKKASRLCSWSTGECDFYRRCIEEE